MMTMMLDVLKMILMMNEPTMISMHCLMMMNCAIVFELLHDDFETKPINEQTMFIRAEINMIQHDMWKMIR